MAICNRMKCFIQYSTQKPCALKNAKDAKGVTKKLGNGKVKVACRMLTLALVYIHYDNLLLHHHTLFFPRTPVSC